MLRRKHKVSLSLPADLVDWIDNQAARNKGGTRSGIVELALRGWAKRSAAKDIEDATVAYYQARTPPEQEEDKAWSRLGEAAFGSEQD